jgi:DNA-binding transcriptional LysR family regulator
VAKDIGARQMNGRVTDADQGKGRRQCRADSQDPRLDLKDLEAFIAVAEAKGFRRAAERLNVEQSALSRRVRRIEDGLGVSLFERHGGGVRLTQAGQRWHEDVASILDSLKAAMSRARCAGTGQNGRLRLGVGATLFAGQLHGLIVEWRKQHPAVELAVIEASPQEHIAGIVDREIDVAVIAGSDWAPICELEELWQDQVNVVMPLSIVEQFACPVPVNALLDRAFIVSRCGFGPQVGEWIMRRLSGLSHSPSLNYVNASRSVLFSMVGLGLGLTFATAAEAEVRYPNLAFLPVENEAITYSALWAAGNDNPALRRFLSLARAYSRSLKCGAT